MRKLVGGTCSGGKVAVRDSCDGEAETKKEGIIYYPWSLSGVSVFLTKGRNDGWCSMGG